MDLSADHIPEEGCKLGVVHQVHPSPPFQGVLLTVQSGFPTAHPLKELVFLWRCGQSCCLSNAAGFLWKSAKKHY